MSYPDSVEYLYALGNEVKSIKFGLEGIGRLLEALGNPHRSFRSVHVAGTNGKGSTCAMVEAALRTAGLRTGLYTSPHLVEPTERIKIAGHDVSREYFARAFDVVHEAAERVLDQHTTYFETVTAMGFWLFREAGVEIAVVETGLGGRLDATNVLTPELCVITPIDFDHEAYLGNSIESIAREKAGILKRGVPAVFAPQRPEAMAVLTERAAEVGATVWMTEMPHQVGLSPRGCDLDYGRVIRCPLAGAHQATNAAVAVQALRVLGVAPEGIANARWPARLEKVHDRPEIVLDGAHNPAGARALERHIKMFYAKRVVWMVYGAMRDKSVEEITEILFPLARRVILTAPSSARAVRPEALAETAGHADMHVAATPAEAVAAALEAPPDAVVFITGSLYLAGEVRPLLARVE